MAGAVTAVYLWTSHGARQVTPSTLLLAVTLALPLSFANAFTEGIVTSTGYHKYDSILGVSLTGASEV